MEKVNNFLGEIFSIRNEEIRDFVKISLEHAPNYFWKIPASSTGKYHPDFSLGEGGLVRHVKAAVKIGIDLLSLEQNKEISDKYRDHIIASLILHDILKKGKNEEKYTTFDHPLQAVSFCKEMKEYSKISTEDLDIICSLIKTHMGQWTTDKLGNKILEKPSTEAQKFVHLCDYLASRKYLEIKEGNFK